MLNESILEDAALEWFGDLGYAVGHAPYFPPGEPAAKRKSCSDVVLVPRLRKAIHQLNPASCMALKTTVAKSATV
jgi:type I restriction enzyme R subunit